MYTVSQMDQQVKNLFAVQEMQKKKEKRKEKRRKKKEILIILRWKKVDLKNKPS